MKKKLGIGGVVLVALVVVARLGLGAWGRSRLAAYEVGWKKDLEAENARVAALRMPVLRGDVQEKDASERYAELSEKVKALQAQPFQKPIDGGLAAGPLPADATKLLDEHRQTIKDLREATHWTRALWPQTKFEDGYEAKIPNLVALRALTHMTVLEGHERALAGDAKDAAEHYLDVVRVGADVATRPVLIMSMIGIALDRTGLQALGDLLVSDVPGVPHDQIAAELAKLDAVIPDPVLGLHGEKLVLGAFSRYGMGVFSIQNVVSATEDQSGAAFWDVVLPASALFAHGQGELDAFWGVALKAAQLPIGERDRAFEAECQKALRSWNPLVKITLPSLGKALRSGDAARALHRLVATLVAIEKKRGADGTYPKDAAALELPVDPCSRASAKLRYEATADGYKLWSVGQNDTDDGGEKTNDGKKDDVAFERKAK